MADPAYPRNVWRTLKLALTDTPVVALLGPRQSGKSTLVRMLAPDRAYVTLDEEPMLQTAREDPVGFVAALAARVTIEEVQRAPGLLLAIKAAVDRDRRPGRFLLTGSANLLLLPKVGDSLAGRIEFIQLHPLTESEKERQPEALLQAFLAGRLAPRIRGGEEAPAGHLQERLLRGGYPPAQLRSPERARQWHRQYLRTVLERDAADVARVRDSAELGRLVEIVALRSASLLNLSALGAELGMRRETVDQYLTVLERLFLVRRLPAWRRNEAKRLIKTPKIYLFEGLSGRHNPVRGHEHAPDRGPPHPRRASFGTVDTMTGKHDRLSPARRQSENGRLQAVPSGRRASASEGLRSGV